MPKLSQDSLEKRFTCVHCGATLRTRQGLSGHLQFKHATGREASQADFEFILSKINDLTLLASAGMSAKEVRNRQLILARWVQLGLFCESLGINLDSKDFKNYIVASFIQRDLEEFIP